MSPKYDEALSLFVAAVRSTLELILARSNGATPEETKADAKRIDGQVKTAARAIRGHLLATRRSASTEEVTALCVAAASCAIVEIRRAPDPAKPLALEAMKTTNADRSMPPLLRGKRGKRDSHGRARGEHGPGR